MSATNGTVGIVNRMQELLLHFEQPGPEHGSWLLHEIVLILASLDHARFDSTKAICDAAQGDLFEPPECFVFAALR